MKNHISPTEQSHVFACGFPPELWNRVTHCLQLKLPNHFPNNPYTLEEIHDTTHFVLHGTALYALAYDDQQQAAQMSAAATKAEPTIKTEDFTALLDVMKQVVSKMGNQGNQNKPSTPRDLCCHFCGRGHFKNSCNVLKEYICDSECILCDDGHITLLGRCFILGTIAGKTFKNCFNEWLWQNPDPAPAPTTNSLLLDVFPDPVTTSFQLMADDRIHSLEKELLLYALAKRRAFACKHRRRVNRKQEKKHLQSMRCPSLCPLPNNQRFPLLKKLLTMSISHWLIHLQKLKMRHIVLRLQTMLLQNQSLCQLKNQKSCTGHQHWSMTCRSPLTSTHEWWIRRLLWHNVNSCPFHQKLGVKYVKPLVIGEYLGLAHRLHQLIEILWMQSWV